MNVDVRVPDQAHLPHLTTGNTEAGVSLQRNVPETMCLGLFEDERRMWQDELNR